MAPFYLVFLLTQGRSATLVLCVRKLLFQGFWGVFMGDWPDGAQALG